MTDMTGFVVLLVLGLIALGLGWGLGQKTSLTTAVTPSSPSPVQYMASAARGDFLVLDRPSAHQLVYTNRTNGLTGTATVTTEGEYLTFGDNPDFSTALEVDRSLFLFQTRTAGAQKSDASFALGLVPKPYTNAAFPSRLLNYMQFRTNDNGFEVGLIDATSATLTNQYFSPSACWFGDGEGVLDGSLQGGVGPANSFPLDAAAFTLSSDQLSLSKTELDQGREMMITIFQTAEDAIVIDMDNGSIFGVPAADDDTLPVPRRYSGLLFGKDDARGQSDHTETGTPLLSRLTLDVEADGQFTWLESGDSTVTFTGTLTPLHNSVSMEGNQLMLGAFHCRLVRDSDTTDICVIKSPSMLLVAYYTHPGSNTGNGTYSYRHGACTL